MVVLDPTSWQPIKIYKMRERDDYPRTQCANIGYEDMRIFRTERGGLQGIAASLHLKRDRPPADGGAQNQPPEQVLVSFDSEYNIVAAHPIRGDGWSSAPQKNWSPFDDCAEPRFLYSIGKGTMFGERGALHGAEALVRPSIDARAVSTAVVSATLASQASRDRDREQHEQREQAARDQAEREAAERRERDRRRAKEQEKARAPKPDLRLRMGIRGGAGAAKVRGAHDAMTSRPSLAGYSVTRTSSETTRLVGSGRIQLHRYEGLRGGTQLVRVGDDAWLGIGHEMNFLKGLKNYWHTWYLVDSKGKMKAASEPMKLVSNGIEFAAGMAIDGDRVVVSFGVDDMECWLGETRLGAVMETLKPVER